MSDALGGKIVLSRNVNYDDLRDLIIADYTNNGRKSLGDLKTTWLPRLDAAFGGTKAADGKAASSPTALIDGFRGIHVITLL